MERNSRRRLAALFGIVYFAQGMWRLPEESLTLHFKSLGLSAGAAANFYLIGALPWVIKPLYGLLSDFHPVLGYRRKSYFVLGSALAALSAFFIASHTGGESMMLPFYTAMGLGLAMTDVMTDAIMVETGKPLGLTGYFQSVQWGAISVATLLVGFWGGRIAAHSSFHEGFLFAGLFPLLSCALGLSVIREQKSQSDRVAARRAWKAVRKAARNRDLWVVAGFVFFFNFSPSFGPAFLYYQTDILHLSRQYIGELASVNAAAGVLGALAYGPISRRFRLRPLIVTAIALALASTLAYLAYRGPRSALLIEACFGAAGIFAQLAFMDLSAKACPRYAEGTFFALLMSIHNGSVQLSMNIGSRLYDRFGFTTLVWISAVATAATWLLVPWIGIERIERQASDQETALAA